MKRVIFTRLHKSLELLAFLALLASIAGMLWRFSKLPDLIPVHYGTLGEPDRWGSKKEVIAIPCVMGIVYFLMTVVGFLPELCNYGSKPIPEEKRGAADSATRTMLLSLKVLLMFGLAAFMTFGIGLPRLGAIFFGAIALFLLALAAVIVIGALYIKRLVRTPSARSEP